MKRESILLMAAVTLYLIILGISGPAVGGFLYGTDANEHDLFRVNPSTAAGELVGDTGCYIESLAYIPEPSVFALLCMGSAAFLAYAWRRRRA